MLKLSIFQRYLLKQYFKTYLGSLVLFLGMFVIIKFMEQLYYFMQDANQLTFWEYPLYFIYEFPNMLTFFIPIATLFSIVYVLGQLNTHYELIAFYNSGKSIFFAVIPIVIYTFFQGLIFLASEKEFVFDNHHKHLHLHRKIRNSRGPVERNRYNLTVFGTENKIYFIKVFKPSEDIMNNVHVLYLSKNHKNFDKIISSKFMKYDYSSDMWHLSNVIIRKWSAAGKLSTTKVKTHKVHLGEKPFHFEQKTYGVEHLSSKEILALAKKHKIIGGDHEYYLTHFFFNTSRPFWPLVIIFFGIPLANFSRKSNVVTSLFIVLVISFFFFICSYIGNSLGKQGFLPPFIAGWFGVIVFSILTYLAIKKRRI